MHNKISAQDIPWDKCIYIFVNVEFRNGWRGYAETIQNKFASGKGHNMEHVIPKS